MTVGQAGPSSRESLLAAAERLLSERGYAATPVSAICAAAGVAVTSLYWHFGNKEGLLAAVLERGAQRWFAALPRWDDLEGDTETRVEIVVRRGAAAVADHPLFLRLCYLLALENPNDTATADLVRQSRRRATTYFHELITGMLAGTAAPETVAAAATELTPLAVAFSDGCFFASQIERADLHRMYSDLVTALRALAPAAIDRATGSTRRE